MAVDEFDFEGRASGCSEKAGAETRSAAVRNEVKAFAGM